MERAGRLIGKLKLSSKVVTPEEMARAAWPVAVGKRLANRTGRVSLYGTTMVVEVEDAVWQSQLTTLSGQILNKIEKLLGPSAVVKLEFRIGVMRRMPQRVENPSPLFDEGDGIQDPVFRQIYIASRRRASA